MDVADRRRESLPPSLHPQLFFFFFIFCVCVVLTGTFFFSVCVCCGFSGSDLHGLGQPLPGQVGTQASDQRPADGRDGRRPAGRHHPGRR